MIHVFIWIIVFGLPLILSERTTDSSFNFRNYLIHCIVPLFFLLTYYINTAFLIPKLLFKNRRIEYLLINLALVLFLTWGITFWHRNVIQRYDLTAGAPPANERLNKRPPKRINEPGFKSPEKHMFGFMIRDFVSLFFVIGLAATIKMSERWARTEKSLQIAQEQKVEAELSNLRNQLNPHFLLNTLNNIYSLITIDATKAQEAVHQLSKLLRHLLYDNKEMFIPITKEAEFLKNYIELMKIRLSGQCDIRVDIRIAPGSTAKIAPFIFISLIENAFKHGLSPTRPSFIYMELKEEDHKIICSIKNSYYPKDESDKSGSGIGLHQVQTRLDLLYKGKYTWKYGMDNNIYYSLLEIESIY